MADLSAVLRKTIDALPSATPQLRAKVYEKARAAVRRQIDAANPPLSEEQAGGRLRSLEDAIRSTEAHYSGEGAGDATAAPAAPPARSAARDVGEAPRETPPPAPPRREPEPVASRPDVQPELRAPAVEPAEPRAEAPRLGAPPFPDRAPPRLSLREPPQRGDEPAEPETPRVGEIGPMPDVPAATVLAASAANGPSEARLDEIPHADMTVPGYDRPRPARSTGRSRGGLAATLAILGLLGAAGAAGYVYRDELGGLLGQEVAETPAATPEAEPSETAAATDPAATPGETADPAAAPTAADPTARQFTQRLQPDGTETDEGPAETAANAFDEGTDVAAASPMEAETAAAAPVAGPTDSAPGGDLAAVPVGQRAVFYEERSADRPGSQRGGNVVWSVVSEPPATGQPAEPAIRAVADVAETNMRMTMTIRRNADATLPASHVIEILFDTPDDFAGGEIENVQRLALKPTEQDRGQPLIGVAGQISEGFFIIALNDLDQAVENNLALLADEEWIDIPMAYASGQRALISLEKGVTGDRVFREALDAWAQRT